MRRPRFRRPGPGQAAFAAASAAVLLAPQVAATVAGVESFPWTCAPMFAHHVGAAEDVYELRFFAERPDGSRSEISWKDVGLQAIRSGRRFFAEVYGSAEEGYPVRAFPGDASEAFSARMASFLAGFLELAERRCPDRVAGAAGVVLALDRVDPRGAATGTRPIGRYDRASRTFSHFPPSGTAWEPAWVR